MADPTQRVDYVEVARLARDAMARGVSARQYVASVLGVPVKHASQMIYRSRVSGHNIPKLPRRPKKRVEKGETFDDIVVSDVNTAIRLVCNTCLEQFSVVDYRSLARHTILEHKRSPLREERMPVTVPVEQP